MRSSNRIRERTILALMLALALAACGGAGPTPSPSPQPTAAVTPDPHLSDPVSVDDLYITLQVADLDITANTASAGPGGEPIKRINATYEGWPLIVSAYSSAEALLETADFDPAVPPRRGQAPYALAGLNILVEYGPRTANEAVTEPDAEHRRAALALVEVLDPLLGPLAQQSIEPLPIPGASPLPAASAPASEAPAGSATAP